MDMTTPPTVHEYLRRIEPCEVDSRGRKKQVPEPRKRAFAATKEVLTAAPTDLRQAVALTLAAAAPRGCFSVLMAPSWPYGRAHTRGTFAAVLVHVKGGYPHTRFREQPGEAP